MEEVEEPKKYENLQTKPVLDPFNSTAEEWTSKKLKSRKLRKFTDKSLGRRSEPPENYEISQTKRTCKHETTKIAMNAARDPSATSI